MGRRRFLSKKEEGLNTEIQKEDIRILELKDQLQELNSVHQQELEAAGQAEESLYQELEKLKIANTEIPTKMRIERALTAELQEKQSWRLGLNNRLQMEKHTNQQRVEALHQELVNLKDNNLEDIKLRAVEVVQLREYQDESRTVSGLEPVSVEKVRSKSKKGLDSSSESLLWFEEEGKRRRPQPNGIRHLNTSADQLNPNLP
ncbi:unnamed protein product [Pleuronectes platessa]|uniref:Uncharacterized protein n=1 Tax=Pleuronectes platessa TaxID=8262 RepID=A0A9N7U2L3_PLEPL|nr:unnamed protein product [Pleuronectes platessa]